MERASGGIPEQTQNMQPGEAALEVIDGIITHIYMPFRGQPGYETERAILVEPPSVAHRENDAEHSWHLAFTCEVLYQNREALGLEFEEGFDIGLSVRYAGVHDTPEIGAGDVDMMTPNDDHRTQKQQKEILAMEEMRQALPWLSGVADLWEEYEPRDKPESQFTSDVDKLIALRMICMDGGRKWHEWEGYTTDKVKMCDTVRSKLYTDIGKLIFAAAERDIEQHPEYFPDDPAPQGSLI